MEYATLSIRKVGHAMHPGVLTCRAETPLREAARVMARFRIHALVLADEDGTGDARGILSATDVVAAIGRGDLDELTAEECARTPLVTVRPDEPLRRVANLMRTNAADHAVVVDREHGRPVGVVSTLDLLRAVASEPLP